MTLFSLKSFRLSLIIPFILTLSNIQAQTEVDFSTLGDGGLGAQIAMKVIEQNGVTYHVGLTNVPSPGAFFVLSDVYFAAQDANGNELYSSMFGGSSFESVTDFFTDATHGYIIGSTLSTDFTDTDGYTNSVAFNGYVTKFDLVTGNIVYTQMEDVNSAVDYSFGEVINGVPTIFGSTKASNYPFTDGSSFIAPNQEDVFAATLDASGNLATVMRVLDGSGDDIIKGGTYQNGKWELYGETASTDLASTNGTTATGKKDVFYTRYNPDTEILERLTYLGSTENDVIDDFVSKEDKVYFLLKPLGPGLPVTDGSSFSGTTGKRNDYLAAMDENLDLTFGFYFPTDDFMASSPNVLEVDDNGFPILGIHSKSDLFPVTGGQPNLDSTTTDIFIMKYTPTGELVFSNRFVSQGGTSISGLELLPDRIAFIGTFVTAANAPQSSYLNYPLTNGSSYGTQEGQNMFFTTLRPDGSISYAASISGSGSEFTRDIYINEDRKAYVVGRSGSSDQPVTNNTSVPGSPNTAAMIVAFDLCPEDFDGLTALSGGTSIACQNGLLDEIEGEKAIYSGSQNPLTGGGVVYNQPDFESLYQWQSAISATGPWTDIPGAVLQNFTPQPVVTDRYFRREGRLSNYCENEVVHTTDVFFVEVTAFAAPDVEAGGIFTTCVGTTVTLGGSPTASNGTAPYTYVWEAGNTVISTDTNPVVSPSETTIYTITVTDANGCQQIDQAQVNVYTADAFLGTLASTCAGEGVRIGGPAIPGLGGVVYAWTPNNGSLSCVDCAQPIANPNTTTTYTLMQTIPVTGGSTCTTMDMITVTVEVAPTGNGGEFAGADIVICRGETAIIGTPAEGGYSYTWAPGQYLTDNRMAQTTFQPGSLTLPSNDVNVPNPITYYITAEIGGCIFSDATQAYVIEADADVDGCGPRTVGIGDKTPHFEETYLWERISGDGQITGATNTAITTVSSSPTMTTIYRLTTTFQGYNCTDEVEVPVCGCVVNIRVDGEYECPDFDLHDGEVCLIASAATVDDDNANLFEYAWSPQMGLSAYTGRRVCLTDNVSRTYTVTMTDPNNPAYTCMETIEVNGPAWSLPTYTAQDAIACPGDEVMIGQSEVVGYAYQWSPNVPAVVRNNSNPTVTVIKNDTYYVTVTDVGTGCAVVDTAMINLLEIPGAGEDRLICDNGTFVLGKATGNPVNYNYSWEPAASNWQNGTDENSANPEVLVAINTTFTMTATDPITGCMVMESVDIITGTPITPFVLGDIEHCPSDGATQLGSGVPAGFSSYTWSPVSLLVDATVAEPFTTSPAPSGITEFTLLVTNADGCEFKTTQTLNSSNDAPEVSGNKFICLEEKVNIGSDNNPTGAGITYSWNPTTDLDDASSPNPEFSATTVGMITFTLTKIEDGCSISSEVAVTVNEYNLPSIPSQLICQGSCVQIGSVPELGVTYQWTPSTGLSNAYIANPVACVNTSTTFTLVARDATGCIDVAEVSVNTQPTQAPTIVLENKTACTTAEPIELTPIVTPTDNYTYSWSPNDASLSDVNIANPTVDIQTAGTRTYTLTATNTATGCSNFESVEVTYENCPVPFDYGDLPDLGNGTTGINDYKTVESNGGPSHQIIVGLFLGDTVDADINGLPDALAIGDDIKDGYDDEDGIAIFPTLNITPGGTIQLPLNVTNTTGDTAYIEAWIDWNSDGDFEDANEMVAAYKDNKDGVFPISIEILVPSNVITDNLLGFRIRLSNTNNMTPYGRVNSGEVEDYLLRGNCAPLNCLPITTAILKKNK